MRKYLKYVCSLLCGLTLLTACEKELMDYEGKDCLYFDIRRGAEWIDPARWAHQYFTTVEFGNLVEDEISVSFKVMASGMTKDYDRSFKVTANNDSTTAISGTDFEGLKDEYVIKAGETNTVVSFTIHRTQRMDGDTLRLQLQLHENEHFKLPFTYYGDVLGTYKPDENPNFDFNKDASIHNIFIFDVLSRPSTWSGNDVNGLGTFGKFSAKKFRLLMQLSNTTVIDYQSASTMPRVRQTAIGQLLAKYLLEKAAAKDPVLDEDGTMMWVSAVKDLGGSSAWSPFTKPEDYFK